MEERTREQVGLLLLSGRPRSLCSRFEAELKYFFFFSGAPSLSGHCLRAPLTLLEVGDARWVSPVGARPSPTPQGPFPGWGSPPFEGRAIEFGPAGVTCVRESRRKARGTVGGKGKGRSRQI